jgi:anti-sigma factor RsiW
MKCEDCLRLLDSYFDGELRSSAAADVAAHLAGCGACSRELRALSDEQMLYLLHRCDDAESPDFWDDLLTKVRAETTTREKSTAVRLRRRLTAALAALTAPRFSPTTTAALLLISVGLTAAISQYAGPSAEAPSPAVAANEPAASATIPPPAAEDSRASETPRAGRQTVEHDPSPAPAAGVGAQRGGKVKSTGRTAAMKNRRALTTATESVETAGAERLVREAEQKYLTAINILSRDVGRRRPRMDQETRARFDRTLAVIDRAIAETRGAAREHPRDPAVVQYMLAAYAKKVEVMREMARD